MPRAKKNKKKDSFAVRLKRRGREFMSLGQTLAHEPKQFPRALLNVVRRSVRTVWDARGGGLYACGYVLTFFWLEISMSIDEILSAQSIGGFFEDQVFEFFFRYLGDSLENMIAAFIWPVFVIEISPTWGVGALVAMYLVFGRWVKQPLEAWLFDDDDLPSSAETNE